MGPAENRALGSGAGAQCFDGSLSCADVLAWLTIQMLLNVKWIRFISIKVLMESFFYVYLSLKNYGLNVSLMTHLIIMNCPSGDGGAMGRTESEVEWERMLQANMEALDDPNKLPEVAWPKELLYRSLYWEVFNATQDVIIEPVLLVCYICSSDSSFFILLLYISDTTL